jgi:Plasmid pRiA4b ORF-3-like protein
MRMSSRERKSSAVICQVKITLKHSSPPIWRRILVAGDTSLSKLHRILQIVMGWMDGHLHQFTIHGRDYGVPDREFDFGQRTLNEKSAKLLDVIHGEKDRFLYEYDFGDGWTHDILVEKTIPREAGKRYPLCLAGKRACPPEDCGGVWG